MLIFLIIFIGLVVLYIMATYNKFVAIKKSRLKNAVQEIGNQLKRQADLIPNLLETVKGYMEHEKEIFEKITEARKTVAGALESNNAQKLIDAGAKLQTALNPIRVVLESNPELKAEGPTMRLMDELRDTADKLTYARRTLIDLTADFNRMVATIPSNMVAKLFGFSELPGLKTPEEGETKTPKVEF